MRPTSTPPCGAGLNAIRASTSTSPRPPGSTWSSACSPISPVVVCVGDAFAVSPNSNQRSDATLTTATPLPNRSFGPKGPTPSFENTNGLNGTLFRGRDTRFRNWSGPAPTSSWLDRLRRRRAPGAQAGHGRATPLVWLSVLKDELKDARNDYEDACLEDACLRRLAEVPPAGVRGTIVAGLAHTKLFDFLGELGFDYVIRLKGNTRVGAVDGTTRPAADWIGQGGRARKLRDATETARSARPCACTPRA